MNNKILFIIIHLLSILIIDEYQWINFLLIFSHKKASKSIEMKERPNGASNNLLTSFSFIQVTSNLFI